MSDKKYPSNLYLESVTTSVDFASHVSVEAVIVMAKELLALRKAREGWQLVPVEPTDEMLRAWRGDMYKSYAKSHIERIGDDEIGFAWNAMIAAAPTPP